MTAGNELTRMQRLERIRAAEVRAGIRDPDEAKELNVVDLTGVYAGDPFTRSWEYHPTQQLVHGPGASDIIERAKGSGRGGSLLWNTISSYVRAYLEPRLGVYKGPQDDLEASELQSTHRIAPLLKRPHPQMTMRQLRAVTAWAEVYEGVGYLIKRRTGGGTISNNVSGRVTELWPWPPSRLKPAIFGEDDPRRPQSNGWTDYYAMDIGGSVKIEVPPENVIPFMHYPRVEDPRMGAKPLKEIAEEIATDAEITALNRAVLSNLGVPGLVFSPDPQGWDSQPIDRRTRDSIKASIDARVKGTGRGSTLVFPRPVRFEHFHADLEKMKLDHIWRHVETRVSGALGWPAILAGFASGLDSATYANVEGLREHATEMTLIPFWETEAEVWTMHLEADAGLADDEWFGYAWNKVRALQQDKVERWKMVGEAWKANALTIAEHHTILDLELPQGVDPTWRRADIESQAQIGGLLGPALGKEWTPIGLLDAVARLARLRKDAPLLVDKQAETWTPDDPTDKLTAEQLSASMPPSEDLADEAHEDLVERIARLDPELEGIADAISAEEAMEEDAEGKALRVKAPPQPSRATWVWDAATQRWRWPNTGRTVPQTRIFRLRERIMEDSRNRLDDITGQLRNGDRRCPCPHHQGRAPTGATIPTGGREPPLLLTRSDVIRQCPTCEGEGYRCDHGVKVPCSTCGMNGEVLTETGMALAEVVRMSCQISNGPSGAT